MVYYDATIVRKGPLARVWLAAHWERKMSKTQYIQVDIRNSVGAIIGEDQPPLALRFSGQLLLGVVKIYSRKARYLLEDCGDALVKLKMAFQTGLVDMPTEMTRASLQTITVGDAVTESDILLPVADFTLEWDAAGLLQPQHEHANRMLARRQDITLRQSYFASASMLEGSTQYTMEDPLQMGLEDDYELDIGDLLNNIEPSLEIEMARDAQAEMLSSNRLLSDNGALDDMSKDMSLIQNMMDLELSTDKLAQQQQMHSMEVNGRDPLLQESINLEDNQHPLDFDVLGDLPSIAELSAQTIGGDLFNRSLLPEMMNEQRQQSLSSGLVSSLQSTQQQQQKQRRRRRRRVLIDEVTELTRQEMMLDSSNLDSDEESMNRSSSNHDWQTIQSDPANYYLGPPSDLPPELTALFQQAQKRAIPDAIETPRLAKHKRLSSSLLAPTPLDAFLGNTPGSILSDRSAVNLLGNNVDISANEPMPPMEDWDDIAPTPGLPGLSPMPLSSFSPLNMASPLMDNSIHNVAGMATPHHPDMLAINNNQLFDEIESQTSQLSTAQSRHTLRAAQLIKQQLNTDTQTIGFNQLAQGAKRSDAARLFFEVLVLNTKQAIRAEQSTPFGDIHIHATDRLIQEHIALGV
ncbi:Rec8 like protein-domain-containing protein [Syncephalis fuscata]|nr:Rec8 like protein-domain-containing protein [Syncephalis fuscata]